MPRHGGEHGESMQKRQVRSRMMSPRKTRRRVESRPDLLLCRSACGSSGRKKRWRVRIVIEQLSVASPFDGGFQLALGFFFGEVFVQQVVEKLVGQR